MHCHGLIQRNDFDNDNDAKEDVQAFYKCQRHIKSIWTLREVCKNYDFSITKNYEMIINKNIA